MSIGRYQSRTRLQHGLLAYGPILYWSTALLDNIGLLTNMNLED